MRRRWCARLQSCGPAVWFPGSCVCVCQLAALQLPLLHTSSDSQRRCQRTASLLFFFFPSLSSPPPPPVVVVWVHHWSVTLLFLSVLRLLPLSQQVGVGERERERERVGSNPSSDSWIREPFADAGRALLVIFFFFFLVFFTSISSVAFKPFLLARLHH